MSKQWGPGAFFLAPSSPRHSLSQSYHPPNVPWGSAGGCWPLALGVWDGEGVIRTLPGSLANTLTASSTPSSPGFSDPYCLLGIEQGMTAQPREPSVPELPERLRGGPQGRWRTAGSPGRMRNTA